MKRYEILGYDKDAGYDITLGESDSKEEVIKQVNKMVPALKKDQILNPKTNEPIDWITVMDNELCKLIWTSYAE